ncbi:glycosyltransferase family 4 protein, partial [Candidatus Parcubacteria bacterium]|nr:glycosyltransferase family 4 protein [Candidatus Parcubacteria bacterium]
MNKKNPSSKLKNPNIGIITSPFNYIAGKVALSKLVEVLVPLSNQIYIFTGNFPEKVNEKVHIIQYKNVYIKKSILIWIFKQILIQLKISVSLIKNFKNVDVIIFYVGAGPYLLPMLSSKLLRKRTVVIATGFNAITTEKLYGERLFGMGIIFSKISKVLEKTNYALSDQIGMAMESKIINFPELEKYKNKISQFGSYFLNDNLFKIKKQLSERRNIIGFVGRLSREKGVIELARAIPLILLKKSDVRFLIIGDGPLMVDMKNELKKVRCLDKVDFVGEVPHEKLPDYFNEMKFHILPSYIEAFGGTAIEAMACGAISIANSVGGLPDVIANNKTGFLLKDNMPQTIADKILEVWDHPELDEIQRNAKEFVEKTLSYEKAIER